MALCVALLAAVASMPAVPAEPDFAIAEGEYASAAGASVGYLTLGLPTHDETGLITNAVLVLPDAKLKPRALLADPFVAALFAPGRPLDPHRYFIIIAGVDSEPFGEQSVGAIYAAVLDQLGINHLRAVLCGGRGCDAGWLIAVRYPYFLDALLAFDGVPPQRLALEAIRSEVIVVAAAPADRADPCASAHAQMLRMRNARCAPIASSSAFDVPHSWRALLAEILEQTEH